MILRDQNTLVGKSQLYRFILTSVLFLTAASIIKAHPSISVYRADSDAVTKCKFSQWKGFSQVF